MKAKCFLLFSLLTAVLAMGVYAQTEAESASSEIVLVNVKRGDTLHPDFSDSLVEYRIYGKYWTRRGRLEEVTDTALTIQRRNSIDHQPVRAFKNITPVKAEINNIMQILGWVLLGVLIVSFAISFLVPALFAATQLAIFLAANGGLIYWIIQGVELGILVAALVLSFFRGKYFDLRRKWRMVILSRP